MQVPGERLEDIGVDPAARAVAGHRPRVPVPSVATVVAQSQIAAKARGVGGTRSVRQVVGDRIGRLVDAGESIRIAVHEGADTRNTIRIGTMSDVDQHEARSRWFETAA